MQISFELHWQEERECASRIRHALNPDLTAKQASYLPAERATRIDPAKTMRPD